MKNTKSEKREAIAGYLFLTPVLIGLAFFFIVPMFNSIRFSFSKVLASQAGVLLNFVGFENYKTAMFVDPDFVKTVSEAVLAMLSTTPLVIVFSFFIANILNQNFKGKTIFKMFMFLPIITASAAMVAVNSGDMLQQSMTGVGSFKETFAFGGLLSEQINQYLTGIGANQDIIATVLSTVNRIYQVTTLSSIQIFIFLIGLQSISPTLYEASDIEGATKWESFWKITFPMISPLLLTCTVYTIIDCFTSYDNQVIAIIKRIAFSNQDFGLSSAMAQIYFVLVSIILAIVVYFISKRIFYYDK